MTSTSPLSRRGFVLAGVTGGALALSGCTWTPRNAGSQQAASCLSDLAAACPGADIREGLSIPGDSVSSSTEQINAWIANNA